MKDYPFLERAPMIFLVGNKDECGFKEVEKSPFSSLTETIDDYGITWVQAIHASGAMAFTHEPEPQSLNYLWIGKTIYYAEAPISRVRFEEQGYSEFYDLTHAVDLILDPKQSDIDALFEYSPPIEKYRIPEPNTYAREVFTYLVKVEKRAEVTKLLDEARERVRLLG